MSCVVLSTSSLSLSVSSLFLLFFLSFSFRFLLPKKGFPVRSLFITLHYYNIKLAVLPLVPTKQLEGFYSAWSFFTAQYM
ncbi:MAG TPA: hypothetical protein VGO47_09335, partial [Chlamydiales bacterium]|nr:hypothetical protein [Chlamydiales bacterium]